jgi:hypothetical protein
MSSRGLRVATGFATAPCVGRDPTARLERVRHRECSGPHAPAQPEARAARSGARKHQSPPLAGPSPPLLPDRPSPALPAQGHEGGRERCSTIVSVN